MIDAELQSDILARYFRDRQSVRKIAAQLNLNRRSVNKIINRRSVAVTVARKNRATILDPHKGKIAKMMAQEADITATAVMQHIRADGYAGGYTSLRKWMVHMRENVFESYHFPLGSFDHLSKA